MIVPNLPQPRTEPIRCPWCGDAEDYQRYHDLEWGVPVHDDVRLYEMITLEGAQAGLSWITILRKREGYREAFDGFDPARVARYTPARAEKLMGNAAIVRNRLKISSTIGNAKAVLAVQDEFGSLDAFLWSHVDGKPLQGARRSMREVPAKSDVSDRMSKALLKRGFRFVGSTICYAFMQAVGMVNDHLVDCHRHAALAAVAPRGRKPRG